jgi:hypothetical protein
MPFPNNTCFQYLLVACSCLLFNNLQAQSAPLPNRFSLQRPSANALHPALQFKTQASPTLASKPTPGTPIKPALCALPPNWSPEKLPFFCKIEYGWAKTNHIPIKFRLGSVEYVDWLEGKRQ